MGSCQKCKYWRLPDSDYDAVRKIMGQCAAAGFVEDMKEWSDEGFDVIKPEYAETMMAVVDASGYAASFYTKPEFYCSMFLERENTGETT